MSAQRETDILNTRGLDVLARSPRRVLAPGCGWAACCVYLVLTATAAWGGPYYEAGVDGYIDPATRRHADPSAADAVLNPVFRGWATRVVEYAPADATWGGPWDDPGKALGPVTGLNFDIVSLGDLTQQEIADGVLPGHITLAFGDPNAPAEDAVIHNGGGYDLVVFENGMVSHFTTTNGSLQGQLLAELAFVEVSSNGQDFVRFPAVSVTPRPTGSYGTVEMDDVHNLAGKHPNAYGVCVGTPFDLSDLADHPDVVAGKVDLDAIRYVRIVDIPGSGAFTDDAVQHVLPDAGPLWRNYPENHPIYDQWPTWGSGGFDLEAVGILHAQQYSADINLDGTVDHGDLSLLAAAWQNRFGQDRWNARCDLSKPGNLSVDVYDFAVFAAQWRCVESWRTQAQNE